MSRRRVIRALSLERVDVTARPGVVELQATPTNRRGRPDGAPSALPPLDPENARRLAARLVEAAAEAEAER